MSSIFPENPEVNDEFQGYRFNGVAWQIIGIDLTAEYPVITNGTISDSAVPATVARTESPTFTGTVELPITTNIGDVSHSEIQTLNGVTHSIQTQIDSKQQIVSGVSNTEIGYLDGVTGSIQAQINGKTTASYVDNAVATAVANVIDTAPGTLDTLNELAAALGDDPNFATTITNALAAKLNAVPGVISQYAGTALPTGYLWCEGGEFLISTYQNLYNALTTNGTVFPYGANTNGSGGSGSTHFRLPNLKGRIPVGKDTAQTEFDVLGETGGAKTHTLTSSEIPAHSHPNTLSDPGHWHYVYNGGALLQLYGNGGATAHGTFYSSNMGNAGSIVTNSVSSNVSINNAQNTGGGGAHNNLQPYIVVNYIIKF
jgi:microcystin-dependent protein